MLTFPARIKTRGYISSRPFLVATIQTQIYRASGRQHYHSTLLPSHTHLSEGGTIRKKRSPTREWLGRSSDRDKFQSAATNGIFRFRSLQHEIHALDYKQINHTSLRIMISSAESRYCIREWIATRQNWQVLPFQNATSCEAFHASSLDISSINLCGSPTVFECLPQQYSSVQARCHSRAIFSDSSPSGALRCCT